MFLSETIFMITNKPTKKLKVAIMAKNSERIQADNPTKTPLKIAPFTVTDDLGFKRINIPIKQSKTAKVCSQYIPLYKVKLEVNTKIKIDNT